MVMGILNVTRDSFYDGGKYLNFEKAISHASKMISQGAQIIDIGAESSRPGARAITMEEEVERILPILKSLRAQWPAIKISIDTTKSAVAETSLDHGADIINDISAGRFDPQMLPLAGRKGPKFVLMHMQGNPENMQINPQYNNVVDEINDFFNERIDACLRAGLDRENLILDPGIGFGKTAEHNYAILANLEKFQIHGLPLLVGLSMKSLLGGDLAQRLPGTIALNTFAALQGVNILRVHHVEETVLALEAIGKIKKEIK
jgi:dihydropteroate synthase